MKKKFLSVFALSNALSFAVKAFDGEDTGAPDGGNTDEGNQQPAVVDFSEESIPAEQRASFDKFKQSLIDKGVNIGNARTKDQFNKNKGKEVDSFLTENGLSRSDIESLKGLAGKQSSLNAIYDAYGTDDIEEIVSIISSSNDNPPMSSSSTSFSEEDYKDENGNFYNMEEIFSDMNSVVNENASLKAQLEAVQNNLDESTAEFEDKEAIMYDFVERMIVGNAIKNAALAAGAYDPEDIQDRVKGSIKMELNKEGDFIPVVVDAEGVTRYNSNGDPLSVADVVNEFLEKRPHLKKSTLPSGAGSKGAAQNAKPAFSAGQFSQEQLRDPKFFQAHYKEIMAAVSNGKVKL